MKSKTNKYEANSEAIKVLFAETGLTQKSIPKWVRDYNLNFSLRQYQRAVEGKILKEEVLNGIAVFFDKFLKEERSSKRNITLKDIVKDNDKPKDFNIKLSNGKLIDQKKYQNETVENCYLHRIESHEQITKIIKQSHSPKVLYPFNPTPNQISLIKKILEDFKTIFASFKKNDKKVSLETYDNLGDEINTLNVISGFSNNVEELKKEGVWLYSNNFIFSSIHIGLAFTEDVYEMFVRNKNYAIFCFQNFKTTSITFEYENSYPKKYLEEFVKKSPLVKDVSHEPVIFDLLEEHCRPYFENKGNIFDMSKTNLIKTDVSELLTDEEYQQIGEEYKKTEEDNAYDDSYDPRLD